MTGLIAKWQVEDDRAVIAELEKKAAPRLMREREARANEASRLALRPLAMQRTLGETLSPIAANLASTDWVISMEAGEGRRLALRVDAAEADKLVEAMGRLSQFDDIEEQGRDPVGENRQRVTLEGRLK
ncbi:MAG: hypothetical protein R3E02_04170 [Blastomonas sp.]